jgi:glycosyltransferase involved in cell wall biosynthesis
MNVVNKVDHVFILNENNIKVLKDYGIKHTKNISILENGCDFMNDNKKAIKNKVFTFGFVGRMLKYKGLENIIQSIKILATKTKKFKVLIIGDGDDLQ